MLEQIIYDLWNGFEQGLFSKDYVTNIIALIIAISAGLLMRSFKQIGTARAPRTAHSARPMKSAIQPEDSRFERGGAGQLAYDKCSSRAIEIRRKKIYLDKSIINTNQLKMYW